MKVNKILSALAAITFASSINLNAQSVDDAMRYSDYNGLISARAGGLGISYVGIADDYAAMFYNPAGLVLVPKGEFSFGFAHNSFKTSTQGNNIFGQGAVNNDLSANSPSLSNIGFVSPFKIGKNNAAVAIGYNFEKDFTLESDYSNFNANSTYSSYLTGLPSDLPYNLFLADIINNKLVNPIKDSLQQDFATHETGSLHSVSGAFSFELSPQFSLGATVTAKWGKYNYSRRLVESDVANIYTKYDSLYTTSDFNSFTVDESISQSVSGINAAIGFMARLGDNMRIGGQIKMPTYYTIDENWTQSGASTFDNGDHFDTTYSSSYSYNLSTPFVYSLGISYNVSGLTCALGLEYNDLSNMELSGDDNYNYAGVNRTIVRELSGQTKWGIGLEYELPVAPLVVRGSYQNTSSPYSNSADGVTSSETATNTYAFGIGFFPSENIKLDLVGRFSDYTVKRYTYNIEYYKMKISATTVALSLTYRY